MQVSEGTVSENAFSTQIAMNTLAEKAYFRVRAVDFRDNLGALSDPLELALPDVMPPAPPHLASVEPVKDGVKAVWSPSPSEDVTHYEVQRRSLLHPAWIPAATIAASDTLSALQTTLDTELGGAADWESRVVATDEAGLTGICRPAGDPANPRRAPADRLKAETTIADKKMVVKLSWEYPYDPLLHEFAVYRSDNGGPMRLVRYLELSAFPSVAVVEAGRGYFVWRDTQTEPGNAYQYRVAARFLDGSDSPLSAVASKAFKPLKKPDKHEKDRPSPLLSACGRHQPARYHPDCSRNARFFRVLRRQYHHRSHRKRWPLSHPTAGRRRLPRGKKPDRSHRNVFRPLYRRVHRAGVQCPGLR